MFRYITNRIKIKNLEKRSFIKFYKVLVMGDAMENSINESQFLQDIFLEETWKNIDKLENFIEEKTKMKVVVVEKEEVASLFRTLHGMKGTAAMMGYPAISETAHSAEDLFAYLREEESPAQEDLQMILQLLRMVCGYLKRELRSMETDDEVTGFGWAVVRRIKNFLAHIDSENEPEGPSYQIAYTRKGKKIIPFINFSTLIPQMERLANMMSRDMEKDYMMRFSGAETEVPRDVYDKISMAILQMIKNSLDHGLELRHIREQLGKPPIGEISIEVHKTQQTIYVIFQDDGHGIDKEIILSQAQKKKLLKKSRQEYTDEEIFDFLFHSGFTTKQKVNLFSGRGVGLDVVKASIGSLGGTIRMESQLYMGTTIFIEFPMVF